MTSPLILTLQRTQLPSGRRLVEWLVVLSGLVLLATLAGCGKKGDPLPPLRFVPAPTQDLSIHQQGNILIFQMGYPQTTAAGQLLPGISGVEIFQFRINISDPNRLPTVDPRMFQGGAERMVTLTGPELTAAIAGNRIEAKLPLVEIPDDPALFVFGVRTVSDSGEASDTSNLVQVVLREAAAPPGDFRTTSTASGVQLDWQAPAGNRGDVVGYNIYRRDATSRAFGAPLESTPATATRFLDRAAEFGKVYIYSIRSVLSADPLVESAPATEREVDYRDRFAPAPPVRVLGLGEGGQARLVWEASPDRDVALFRIYRQDTPEGEFRRVAEVDTLEYLDTGLAPGTRFVYRVSSVDQVGNEGAPGNEVSVLVE
jgi:predicted small lipoprotein YifL